jgi:hypothetical protein
MSTTNTIGPSTTRPCRCVYCKHEVPIATPIATLAFFEPRGPGTQDDYCMHCRYSEVAHTRKGERGPRHLSHVCNHFEPMIDGYDHDVYYCGCRGWD